MAAFCAVMLAGCGQRLIIDPAPGDEQKSDDFEITVNDRPVFVYRARVSKYPINQIWPGYQRPVDQTELASFASFDFDGEVKIRIHSSAEIQTLDIRPKEYGIQPIVKGKVIEFSLSKPLQLAVEVNGYHHALHVFANPVEDLRIDKDSPNIHYFGPGVHEAGKICVKSGETIYIAGGALVYGYISSENARNIRIAGRGILDASRIKRGEAPSMIWLKNVIHASVSGMILRDSPMWTITATNCDSVNFDNLKLIGHWRYNSDGLDICNCKNIRFENSFIRTFDDNIVVRGQSTAYVEPYKIIENITVNNCVLWNDWGRAIEIGADTYADTIRNIRFTNCQIPRFTAVALDIQNCDRGHIREIYYDNIAVEEPITDSLTLGAIPIVPNAWGKIAVLGVYSTLYSSDSLRGTISHISFNNIRYNPAGTVTPLAKNDLIHDTDPSISFKRYDEFIRDNIYFGDIDFNCRNIASMYFSGLDSDHRISDIRIKDYRINGEKVSDPSTIGKNEFVNNIILE
jgi:hypothetical protein